MDWGKLLQNPELYILLQDLLDSNESDDDEEEQDLR